VIRECKCFRDISVLTTRLQSNLAVLKRAQVQSDAADAIAAAASSVVGKQLKRPPPNADFEERCVAVCFERLLTCACVRRATYIVRLYCALSGVRRPTTLAPLDAIDGFLYRRVASNSTWRREPVRHATAMRTIGVGTNMRLCAQFRLRGTSLVFDKQKALSKQTETISLVAAEIRALVVGHVLCGVCACD
jgi:hypothetical protein